MEKERSYEELLKLLEETEYRLEEANETINAIRSGEIDALIVNGENGHQVFTLKSADHTFRIFIEQMTEGAITLNRDGIILYSNTSFASIAKLPLEKIPGSPFKRFLTAIDQEIWKSVIAGAWEKDTKLEFHIVDSEREIVPVLLSLKTLLLVDGLAMSVIITDLSLQKESQLLLQRKNAQLAEAEQIARHLNATLEKTVEERTKDLQETLQEKEKIEQDLRSNQEQLSRILETMAEGVVILDLTGNLNYANPMAQTILGITLNDRQDGSYNDPEWPVLNIDGSKLLLENYPINTAMKSGKPLYDFEIAIDPPDRERFYISMNAAPITGKDGKVTSGIGTFMDVTHRRKAIQQKDDFISVASHELRTPVTTLKASLQLLEKMKDKVANSPLVPKLIDQANRSMHKMSILIEDLLNATNMTEGHLKLALAPVNIKDLLNECCEHAKMNGGITITTSGDLTLQVNADVNKIDQVLVNFISNAIKYASASKEIIISSERLNDMVKISVTDQGNGIPKAKLPHLFERYYRAESDSSSYSGLGLGLYICSQIVKKHGGEIGADSELGKGSTFWFTLPLSRK